MEVMPYRYKYHAVDFERLRHLGARILVWWVRLTTCLFPFDITVQTRRGHTILLYIVHVVLCCSRRHRLQVNMTHGK